MFYSSSAIAFSNRAMAYLKTKEFKRAESDATTALSIDPRHVKVGRSFCMVALIEPASWRLSTAILLLCDVCSHFRGVPQLVLVWACIEQPFKTFRKRWILSQVGN